MGWLAAARLPPGTSRRRVRAVLADREMMTQRWSQPACQAGPDRVIEPPSFTPPGSPAASGSAISPPAWSRPMRPLPSRCSGQAGSEHPPHGAGGHHRRLRRGAADRGAAARRRQLTVRTLLLGMQFTLADDRPGHLTRVPGLSCSGAGCASRGSPGPRLPTLLAMWSWSWSCRRCSAVLPGGAGSPASLARYWPESCSARICWACGARLLDLAWADFPAGIIAE